MATKIEKLKKEAAECKRMEHAWKESEERFRSMMEAMNDSVYICSPDYRITYMNPAMVKRIGRNAIGEPCYEIIHEYKEKCPWCVHDKVQQGELCQIELVSPKDGHFYHVSHSPIFHTDGSISKMTIYRDFTRLKQTQEALPGCDALHRSLVEHVTDGVTLVQEGKFLLANQSFFSMFGYDDPKQIIGKKSEDLNMHLKVIFQPFESGISVNKPFRTACHDLNGREFLVEISHKVIKWRDKPAFIVAIKNITKKRPQEIAQHKELKHPQKGRYELRKNIIGRSPAIQEVYDIILKAANSDNNVVIYGESGTGKELVAQAIHKISNRNDGPFVSVNCSAIVETLFESEFFGYKKGAFTGAYTDKHGFLDLSDNGTLFLDELGELSHNMQVKLLRAIDGNGYSPVGSNMIKRPDFRIIAATNKNPVDQLRRDILREDFFYRVHVIQINVPPLRDRKEDIPLLVDYFLGLWDNGNNRLDIPEETMRTLHKYQWPGNVRELQNVLQRYLTLNRLDLVAAPTVTRPEYLNGDPGEVLDLEDVNLHHTMKIFQKKVIVMALNQAKWHRGRAANMLGIDRKTLFRKMKSLEVV